jgi:hypothetical protein
MMFQFPFPPPPDMPLDPPGPAFQLLVCILFVLMWFKTIVMFLPERWREKISELQFPTRAAKKGRL